MVLYLDIDGVMVPANSWRRPEILEDGFPNFSEKASKSLNRILSVSSADIVLTTSHKHNYSLSEWKKIFLRRNILVNKISRLPKNTQYFSRKEELVKWFTNHKSNEDFLIIDDDKSLNDLPLNLKEHLLQTSGSVGLTDQLAEEGLAKLAKGLKKKIEQS
ncbi:MAG: hypothetical protein SchgKO_10840 [Schleiferiaceae bacterium]